jgi:GAF domain-containing protein
MQTTNQELTTQSVFQRLLPLQDRLLSMGPDTPVSEVLEAIAEEANAVMGGAFCVVMPYDSPSDKFLVDQFTPGGDPAAKSFKWTQPRPDGTAHTILAQRFVLVRDFDKEKDRHPFLKEGSVSKGAFRDIATIQALIGTRLDALGEQIGVLVINYREPHDFSESDIQTAELFARLAASAIRNVKLFEGRSRILARLKGLVTVTQSVSDLRKDIDPQQALERVVEAANEVLGADLSVIFPYDQQADSFLMDQLVAAGKGATTYQWQMPRKKGGTRKILEQDIPIAMNLQDASEEWASLLSSGAFKTHFEIQAMAGVPLRVGTEKVGVLYVNYRAPHSFDEQERDLIQAFANEAAIAISNMRLLTERERRIRELTSLSEIQREILDKAFDLDQVTDSILARGQELIGAGIGQLLLVEGDRLVIHASTGADQGQAVRIDNSVSGIAVKKRDIVNVSDVSEEKPYCDVYQWFLGRDLGQEMRSELVVPLIVENEVIGVLNIESPEVGAFTSDHERLMTMLAHQAALAIRLARRYKELEVLAEIQRSILSETFDLDKTIKLVLERMLKLLRATYGQLSLCAGKELIILGSTGADVGVRVQIDDCVSGLAVKEGKPVRVANVHTEEPYKTLYKWFLGKETGEAMKSELVVPMLSEDRVIGVLNVESPSEGAFTVHDEVLLMTLAGQAATALKHNEDHERAKLAAVGEMSGDMVHRLNNPIGAILWRIERLREKKADLLSSDVDLAKALEWIDGDARRIQDMVRDLKRRAAEPPSPFEVWPLLTAALSRILIPPSIQVVTYPATDLPKVLSTPKLESVFENLITNAVEAMPDGGRLEIIAEVEGEDWIHIFIRDAGRGIPLYLLEEIFKPTFTTKGEEGEVHGLGLWWSRAFIEQCGGTIMAQSEVGKGSCLIVRLRAVR